MAHNSWTKHLGQTGSRHLVGITVGSNPVEEVRQGIIKIIAGLVVIVCTLVSFPDPQGGLDTKPYTHLLL